MADVFHFNWPVYPFKPAHNQVCVLITMTHTFLRGFLLFYALKKYILRLNAHGTCHLAQVCACSQLFPIINWPIGHPTVPTFVQISLKFLLSLTLCTFLVMLINFKSNILTVQYQVRSATWLLCSLRNIFLMAKRRWAVKTYMRNTLPMSL